MSEIEIVVYTQTHCSSCKQVERFLADEGCEFTVRDVFEDAEALAEITSRGFMSTPVTRIGDDWIAGYRPGRIKKLIAAARE